jgi:Tol biopolymer transport system component
VQRIVRSTRAPAEDFPVPAVVPELDSGAGDADPALSLDERVIVFSSARGGSLGGGNLWYAVRLSTTQAFGMPKEVPDLNTAANDGDPWLSDDGCRLYFASDRVAASGWEIFVATAEP